MLNFPSSHRSVLCPYPYLQFNSFTTARGRIVSDFAGAWEALTNQSGDRAKAKRQERILADRYKINISTAEDLITSIEFQLYLVVEAVANAATHSFLCFLSLVEARYTS